MANGLFTTIDPLYGLDKLNIPGVSKIPGAENYITGQQIGGGIQGFATGIKGSENLPIGLGALNTLANTILGAKSSGEKGMMNLANYNKLRQDLLKTGINIQKGQYDLAKAPYDVANAAFEANKGQFDANARANLLRIIQQLPPEQQALAGSDPKAWLENFYKSNAPTNDVREYEYALKQYKAGNAPNPGSFQDWYRNYIKLKSSTVTVNTGEDKYAEELGKQLATQDFAFVQQADNVPMQLNKMDETLKIIRNPSTQVGKMSSLITDINAIKDQFLDVDNQIKESIGNTQLLDALLGSEVFPMIKALGIGARGLDTPAEREFLRKVMTGTVELNRDTLTKMTMIRRRQFQKIAQKYNAKLKSGGLKDYQKLKPLNPIEFAQGKGSAFIASGTDNLEKKRFSVFADGSAYYLNNDGTVSDEKVSGFDWINYNYNY